MIDTIYKLTPDPTERTGVVATERGTTEKGYLYEPNDIITTTKRVIDRRSYNSDYTEVANDGGNVTFIKTKQMEAITIETLVANIDEFNANVSTKWIENSVKAKGIESDGRTAFFRDGKLVLVTSERVCEVPDNSLIMFNIDEDGRYYNVYYCPIDVLGKMYINTENMFK
ncbi:MAG: hypothetical protein J5595_04925 [Bacteroidales bacterium]|jgi:hypothetical protein|nr:hypothetical protein [Bacteroidales bacterium]